MPALSCWQVGINTLLCELIEVWYPTKTHQDFESIVDSGSTGQVGTRLGLDGWLCNLMWKLMVVCLVEIVY